MISFFVFCFVWHPTADEYLWLQIILLLSTSLCLPTVRGIVEGRVGSGVTCSQFKEWVLHRSSSTVRIPTE